MPVAHLTDIVVSRLKNPGTYFDETTPAFGIRVGKNRKTWIVMRGVQRQRVRVDATTKREIDDALKAIGEVLRVVNQHFTDSDMMFDRGDPRVHGFVDLLYVMRDGLKAREEREERMRAGKYTADDLKHEDL